MRKIENNGVAGYVTVETIRNGPQAWSNEEGGRWREWEHGLAQEIYDAGMDFSLPDPAVPANAAFECLDRVEFKGRMYIGYRQQSHNGMVIISAGPRPLNEKEIQEKLSKLQQVPKERHTVFVDWPSMLPAYDILAPANQLDNPRSRKHYTYPGDITIEPPAR
jgi:hypothetical protein